MDEYDEPAESARIALADAVLALAHHLELRGQAARDVAALTGTEITVIREVHRTPGTTATRIAATTGLQRSFVSASAHALEGRGLLTRGPAAAGERGVGFHPTLAADEDLARVHRHWLDVLAPASSSALAAAAAATAALEEIIDSLGAARTPLA
ncbi:MAG: MarR family protein [Microbacterium sp.]|jgi:DNA-binding MarR family transcriptional regulator|nr:MarR family protein [Microbacterium sp.]